jgi:hypothetical protein
MARWLASSSSSSSAKGTTATGGGLLAGPWRPRRRARPRCSPPAPGDRPAGRQARSQPARVTAHLRGGSRMGGAARTSSTPSRGGPPGPSTVKVKRPASWTHRLAAAPGSRGRRVKVAWSSASKPSEKLHLMWHRAPETTTATTRSGVSFTNTIELPSWTSGTERGTSPAGVIRHRRTSSGASPRSCWSSSRSCGPHPAAAAQMMRVPRVGAPRPEAKARRGDRTPMAKGYTSSRRREATRAASRLDGPRDGVVERRPRYPVV